MAEQLTPYSTDLIEVFMQHIGELPPEQLEALVQLMNMVSGGWNSWPDDKKRRQASRYHDAKFQETLFGLCKSIERISTEMLTQVDLLSQHLGPNEEAGN